MLDLVQLGPLARRKPHQLSGGQQQRVAVARALINQPEVLLLDEPLGALDLKLRRQMQLELKRIQTEVGITFIHVTHDQEEAMTMADTVAVMNAGRVEQMGAPADLYENPASTFVANFLGTSNLIETEVTGADGGDPPARRGRAAAHPARRALPAPRRSAGGRVLVGVRPEKITMAHRGRRGRDTRGPQPRAGPDRRLQLHRRLHPVRGRQPGLPRAGGLRAERGARRPAGARRARWSCTGTPSTPSASTRARTSTPA